MEDTVIFVTGRLRVVRREPRDGLLFTFEDGSGRSTSQLLDPGEVERLTDRLLRELPDPSEDGSIVIPVLGVPEPVVRRSSVDNLIELLRAQSESRMETAARLRAEGSVDGTVAFEAGAQALLGVVGMLQALLVSEDGQ